MNILALNPYHGGSHQAFLDGWASRSTHHFTVHTLPASKWKWRMRHAGLTFAEEVSQTLGGVNPAPGSACPWDVIFCTDMMNLAEFRGLAPEPVRQLPTILYFHENQLTYPESPHARRDHHPAFINIISALTADALWFNSAYHRDSFVDAAERLLRKMPDKRIADFADRILAKAAVHPQGISLPEAAPPPRSNGPLHVLWAARWEYDKNPEAAFAAMQILLDREVDFKLSVLGQASPQYPDLFDEARNTFADRIVHWGFLPERNDYEAALGEADVILSTADHEFFGIAVAEAVTRGAFPVVPHNLAYPEVLAKLSADDRARCFHDGSAESAASCLTGLAERKLSGQSLWDHIGPPSDLLQRYAWPTVAAAMDEAAAATGRDA
jgi:glycosyltransferase involved in cell wall biosynthesis